MRNRASVAHATFLLLVILCAFIVASCSSKSTEPEQPAFELVLTVVDSTAAPIAGLRVSVWSKTDPWLQWTEPRPNTRQHNVATKVCPLALGFGAGYPNPFKESVTLQVYITDSTVYDYTLQLVDMNERVLDTVTRKGIRCGVVSNHFTLADSLFGMFRVDCEISDSSGIVYTESRFVARWTSHPEANVIGYTSAGGTVRTADSLRFPSLVEAPEIAILDANGSYLNDLRFLDSATVELMDTLSGASQRYDVPIGHGGNAFTLIWNP